MSTSARKGPFDPRYDVDGKCTLSARAGGASATVPPIAAAPPIAVVPAAAASVPMKLRRSIELPPTVLGFFLSLGLLLDLSLIELLPPLNSMRTLAPRLSVFTVYAHFVTRCYRRNIFCRIM